MAAFYYAAVNVTGKRTKGVIEAESIKQARQQLRERGLAPLKIEAVKASTGTPNLGSFAHYWRRWSYRNLSARDLTLITRQLATLVAATIPLDEALATIVQQNNKHHIKSIILGVRSRVLAGHSLASGMEDFPRAFPKLYRSTIYAGEKSGRLDQVLLSLADYIEKQSDIKQKVRQALIYPLLMTAVSIAIVLFLLVYIVPKITDVFVQMKQTLPWPTEVLLNVSQFARHDGLIVIACLALMIYFLQKLLQRERYRKRAHRFLLALPLLGENLKTINSARFGRTIGILSAAGVPIIEAMQAAAKLITPLPMRYAVLVAIERVREGVAIHNALREAKFFSPMFVHLVASGEATGQLEQMLEKAATQQENDAKALITALLTLFEPVMILFMGGIVLFIVLAIMLPIFALDQSYTSM